MELIIGGQFSSVVRLARGFSECLTCMLFVGVCVVLSSGI